MTKCPFNNFEECIKALCELWDKGSNDMLRDGFKPGCGMKSRKDRKII